MHSDWRHVLETAFPGEEARYFTAMSIGDTPAAASEGAAAILSGDKTATSSPHWEYPDGRGGPGCLNSFSASISGASAGVRLPRGGAAY